VSSSAPEFALLEKPGRIWYDDTYPPRVSTQKFVWSGDDPCWEFTLARAQGSYAGFVFKPAQDLTRVRQESLVSWMMQPCGDHDGYCLVLVDGDGDGVRAALPHPICGHDVGKPPAKQWDIYEIPLSSFLEQEGSPPQFDWSDVCGIRFQVEEEERPRTRFRICHLRFGPRPTVYHPKR